MDNRSTIEHILCGHDSDPDEKITRYVQIGLTEPQFDDLEEIRRDAKLRSRPELFRRILNAFIRQYQRIKNMKSYDFSSDFMEKNEGGDMSDTTDDLKWCAEIAKRMGDTERSKRIEEMITRDMQAEQFPKMLEMLTPEQQNIFKTAGIITQEFYKLLQSQQPMRQPPNVVGKITPVQRPAPSTVFQMPNPLKGTWK